MIPPPTHQIVQKKEGCDDVIYRQTAMTSLSLRWPFLYYC